MTYSFEFIQSIRQRRRAIHATQAMLAEAAGISKTYLCSLEIRRRKNPSYDIAKKLEDALLRLETAYWGASIK
ncbi:MAG: helix-turn-helix transcriptional regulator [Deltaproteobacteria bacterium]|nr:helix-turn-helix transcriptional regulator [Deltaproteobacteria bacterium]